MDIREIIADACRQYRKGSDLVIDGQPATAEQRTAWEAAKDGDLPNVGGVVEFFMMPPISDAPESFTQVDVHFMVVGVDTNKAKEYRNDLDVWIKTYLPNKVEVSYIELGGMIGDQGMALSLMALAQVAGLGMVLTPELFGIGEPMASQLAGVGMVSLGLKSAA